MDKEPDKSVSDSPTEVEDEDKDYDLENGVPIFYRYSLPSGNTFIVTRRFSDLSVVGHGSYGIVCSAYDEKMKKRVAIKRNNVLENFLYCKRMLRELVILRVLDHPNIIKLHHIQRIVDYQNFNSIYLVTDLMEADLDQVIKSDQALTNEHIQYFMYQVLLGIKYIHSAGLIHRDLKPQNILINSNCDVKICDFGLSVSENQHMTHYVVSRWYRAPELVIGDRKYNKSIDMWSVGCIFGELILRRTLFPGKSPFDQFMRFIRILGTPKNDCFRAGIPAFLRDQITRKEKEWNNGFPFPSISFEVIFKNKATTEAIDLLKKLIVYDSRKRFSVEQALSHPYFADLHDPRDEPVADFQLRFEDYEKKLKNYKEVKLLIYKQSLIYNRKELRRRFLNPNYNPEEEEKKAEEEEKKKKKEEEEEEEELDGEGNKIKRRSIHFSELTQDDGFDERMKDEDEDGMNELENEIRGFQNNSNNDDHGGFRNNNGNEYPFNEIQNNNNQINDNYMMMNHNQNNDFQSLNSFDNTEIMEFTHNNNNNNNGDFSSIDENFINNNNNNNNQSHFSNNNNNIEDEEQMMQNGGSNNDAMEDEEENGIPEF